MRKRIPKHIVSIISDIKDGAITIETFNLRIPTEKRRMKFIQWKKRLKQRISKDKCICGHLKSLHPVIYPTMKTDDAHGQCNICNYNGDCLGYMSDKYADFRVVDGIKTVRLKTKEEIL